MTSLVNLDPYFIQWIKEWVKHQELTVEIENLGKPLFRLPPIPKYGGCPLAYC